MVFGCGPSVSSCTMLSRCIRKHHIDTNSSLWLSQHLLIITLIIALWIIFTIKGWVAFRQGVECGFQGRTNKLVDGCYSFWQGAALALTQKLMTVVDEQLKSSYSSKRPPGDDACGTSSSTEAAYYAKFGFDFIEKSNQIGPLFHNIALQQYILLCAQVLDGGLRDKPGKNRDHYHSCYCLSGLSVSQYSAMVDSDACPLPQHVLGPYSNLLEPIHPLYNVVLDKYHTAYEFFSS
jgi:protein farnesyltransferase subunit beta